MTPIPTLRRHATAILSLCLVAWPSLSGGATFRVPQDLPLQGAIDAAAPGDTVLVAPGDYSRAAVVDKAIVIRGDGEGVRLAGLSGGLARLENLVFAAQLDLARNRLVEAASGLILVGCGFEGAVQGIAVQPGAGDLEILDCRFTGQVQGITLDATSGGIRVVDTDFDQCLLAITSPLSFDCEGGDRRPANRCRSGCQPVELVGCSFVGGDIQVSAGPGFEISATGCAFIGGRRGIQAVATAARVEDCTFTAGDSESSALEVISGTGSMTESTLSGYPVALRVGDGGTSCGPYSDFALGGSFATANTLFNNLVNLVLTQNEPIPAEFNHWGSLNCASVQESIQGQQVSVILDASLSLRITCSVPVTPLTWGGLKSRAAPWPGGRP